MTATAEPTAQLTTDDLYRLTEIAELLAVAAPTDKVTVRIIGAAEPGPCAACDPGEATDGERVAGDVLVHWGYARPCYRDDICLACLPRFLRIHTRHDHARPIVDVPAVIADPGPTYPPSGPYSPVPVR